MKALSLLLLLIAGMSRDVAFAQSPEYVSSIDQERQEMEADFRDPEESPLDEAQRAVFAGLDYFPIDTLYKVSARFTPATGAQEVVLGSSGGDPRPMIPYGTLRFSLHGAEHELTVYDYVEPIEEAEYANHLFLPFKDATSGKETYGGGRYMDLWKPLGETVELDFNLAYNPSCAYNVQYSCTMPPRENHLAAAIEAGVKAFESVPTSSAEWVRFVSEEGGYSVEMPGTPSAATAANGMKLKTLESAGNAFLSGHLDLTQRASTPEQALAILNAGKEAAAGRAGFRLIEEQPITYASYPGLAYSIREDESGLTSDLRVYVVGDRVIALTYVYAAPDRDSEAAERFFSSLSLDSTVAMSRLERLLHELGYEYKARDSTSFSVTFSYDDGRSQVFSVGEYVNGITGLPYYDVWSTISRSPDALPAEVLQEALTRNGKYAVGTHQLFLNEGEHVLVFSAVVPVDVDASVLQAVSQAVAETADEEEKEWVGKDEF